MDSLISDEIETFSIFEVAKKECYSLLDMILDNLPIYNFDIDSQDENGDTLLHIICAKSEQAIAQRLINLGCNVNISNNICESPLYIACSKGNLSLAKLLVKNNADLQITDTNSRSLLHLAAEKNSLELCKFLIDSGADLNAPDSSGATPLHYAVELNFPKIILLLVHKGADVNRQDLDGYTPLHIASKTNAEIVKFLLRNKAATSIKTFNGDLPLHLAASSGNHTAVTILLNGGIGPNCLNNDNCSPAQLAEMNGHEKVAHLLRPPNVNKARKKSRIIAL
ncbi:putative ankyrin repeat protein RF_0381 [Tribolium castaneum]|uniref:Transient receptor potential channel pyrexia-like Protein n=1 Tax=Tribolium castaneum TaxID=7070 RepID=D6X396_TRICA|nr:PREDICTED: putative ankyrin repeat protein RF_0381 [Tribolium castaneum]EFA10350.1 Transient receptor potential channel pyrexia-like Protein [Tribolium castaneum]|eukprot:XP_008198032.1 PREDICTED: putative ankyrin repeat protein RF_0381 [Tribolium castaneum]